MSPQKSRQIKNEQLLRNKNQRGKDAFKQYLSASPVQAADVPLKFNCECSDLNCGESVTLSIQDYERIHARQDRFVLVKGHQAAAVEKVIHDLGDYLVVEKFALSP
jgi:hypothetical protein